MIDSEFVHDAKRCCMILRAIFKCLVRSKPVPVEWMKELSTKVRKHNKALEK